jgi:uracil-DNA glycosylase
MTKLERLKREASACRVCETVLPLGPRPIFRASSTARILVIGQAPGRLVHQTGSPWNDSSGSRLRDWLGLDRQTFYDEARIAIIPMGFCYPGTGKHGGDNPPRPECAPLWQRRFLALMPRIELTLLIGSYAQVFHLGAGHLGARRKASMSENVAAWREHPSHLLALPHPSWHNTAWLKRNPWFERELLPVLRQRVASAMEW